MRACTRTREPLVVFRHASINAQATHRPHDVHVTVAGRVKVSRVTGHQRSFKRHRRQATGEAAARFDCFVAAADEVVRACAVAADGVTLRVRDAKEILIVDKAPDKWLVNHG